MPAPQATARAAYSHKGVEAWLAGRGPRQDDQERLRLRYEIALRKRVSFRLDGVGKHLVRDDGRTTCCGAFTTFDVDSMIEVCRKCLNEITGRA